MNKTRIEFLSDAVFSIVMTLLVLEIKVPEIHTEHGLTDAELWPQISHLTPLFLSYLISFTVLTMYWVSNHALFHFFIKKTDRAIAFINMLFLMFVSIIPFSAHFLGVYPDREPAVIVYGVNLILIGMIGLWMLYHVLNHSDLVHKDLTQKTIKQAKIRLFLTPTFSLLGVVFSVVSIPFSLFLFAFPIIFNIIPGTLNTLEKVFKFELR